MSVVIVEVLISIYDLMNEIQVTYIKNVMAKYLIK